MKSPFVVGHDAHRREAEKGVPFDVGGAEDADAVEEGVVQGIACEGVPRVQLPRSEARVVARPHVDGQLEAPGGGHDARADACGDGGVAELLGVLRVLHQRHVPGLARRAALLEIVPREERRNAPEGHVPDSELLAKGVVEVARCLRRVEAVLVDDDAGDVVLVDAALLSKFFPSIVDL